MYKFRVALLISGTFSAIREYKDGLVLELEFGRDADTAARVWEECKRREGQVRCARTVYTA